MQEQTYLEAAAPLPLSHYAQLPLDVSAVLPQSRQEEATLAARQEEGAGQTEELVQTARTQSAGLELEVLVARRAGLVSQQAEQLLYLRHRQHWFDVVGEHS